MYLNQLPPTEVARLKAELAETLIAHFCYPRFYDYRVNALRMRPVDRIKRQEVWQYLNAVDFNVWGRVDLDSVEFQRQVERLLIHFVQRNRNFFGAQGRRRMVDVRSLITGCSNTLAEALRGHLQGQQGNRPFGAPYPVSSWSTTNISDQPEPSWEQILPGTMQLQQQLQELRGEVRSAGAPSLAPVPATPPVQVPVSPPPTARPNSVPSRRPRSTRSVANGTSANGNGVHEDEHRNWSQQNRGNRPSDGRISVSFAASQQSSVPGRPEFPSPQASSEAAQTMPLPLDKPENMPTMFQPAISSEMLPSPSGRQKRVRPSELDGATSVSSAEMLRKSVSQSAQISPPVQSVPTVPAVTPVAPQLETIIKSTENGTVLMSDEDVVIFEQMRHQLLIWLRIEAVRAGIELGSLGAFQLAEALRQKEGIDLSRLQIVSTLLNMCDQIVNAGRASLFDYKQAMMFYLMHTGRAR